MKRAATFISLCAFGLSLASPPRVAVLAGSEVDTESQSYTYAGVVLSRSLLPETYVLLKTWGDFLTYRFPHGDASVKAKAPASQLSLGLGKSSGSWIFILWSGWERRDTEIDPDVKNVEVKGIRDSLLLQIEAHGSFEPKTAVSFITSYSSGTSYLWSRARLKRTISESGVSFGLEVLGHGNEDYRAFQSGLLLEIQIAKAYILLKGGSKNSSQGNSVYGGAEFYLGF